MGLSFRKSIQIIPGVKLNISKSGLSVSTGIPGLHASINTKGQVRGTASLPGTGLRYTKSKKLTDLIPGKTDKQKSSKEDKKPAANPKKQAPVEDVQSGPVKTEKAAAKEQKLKKNELAQAIIDIYAIADKQIEWIAIKNSSSNIGYENWDYLKERAGKVLDGDIDTYLEVINDVNPFNELIEIGCDFSCGTDNPMKMYVEATIDPEKVLGESKDDKELLEDLVAGIALKSARDIFALLPLWQVEVTAVNNEATLLNAKFQRDTFEVLNFDKIDASDTIKKLGGIIAV